MTLRRAIQRGGHLVYFNDGSYTESCMCVLRASDHEHASKASQMTTNMVTAPRHEAVKVPTPHALGARLIASDSKTSAFRLYGRSLASSTTFISFKCSNPIINQEAMLLDEPGEESGCLLSGETRPTRAPPSDLASLLPAQGILAAEAGDRHQEGIDFLQTVLRLHTYKRVC